MPSEIAHTIVNHVFSDERAKAIDAMNDALSASAYDAIQQQKVEFAKMHGFNPDDTAQDVADEIADNQPPAGDVQDVDFQGRKPEDAPADEMADEVPDPLPPNTAVVDSIEPIEEPENETNS